MSIPTNKIQPAPIAADEARRVDALRRYAILDSEPEPAFDEIARLAAFICRTPTAMVSLVDASRQWFKARVGIDTCETDRDIAFCDHAIRQHALMIVPDAAADPRFATNPLVTGPPFIRFYAGAPLVTDDGLALGALCVVDSVPRTLDAAQQSALQMLARQVVAQMELRRHVAEQARQIEERRRAEMELRAAHAKQAATEQRLRNVVESIGEGLLLTDAEGIVLMANPRITEMTGFDTADLCGKPLTRLLAPPHRAHRAERSQNAETYEIEILHRDGSRRWTEVRATPFRDATGMIVGTLRALLDISERKNTEASLERAHIDLKIVNAHLERLSRLDPLTGIHNRRAFEARLDEEMERARRYDRPLSVLMLDVDHFKSYNDTFGHLAGDAALKRVARVLETSLREFDFLARYGGEEFVALLPNTASSGAIAVAERLRSTVFRAGWTNRVLTISVGAATLIPATPNGDALVADADNALYAAKNAGRDRATHASEMGR